jgi:myo-inositol-1(or 4)-monophosphatase
VTFSATRATPFSRLAWASATIDTMNPYLEFAVETAEEAGTILLAELTRPVRIDYKGEADIVTQADKRSEAATIHRLSGRYPKHAIVAEESGTHTAITAETAGAKYCWYVDPLDGTTNFAHGYPWFCVSIGLAAMPATGAPGPQDLLVGVVYQPVTKEMFTASRGEGAYLNKKKIQVSKIDRLATALLGTGFPAHKRSQNPNIYYYWDFTMRSHGVRRAGSAALDLASVACGRFDGFWEFGLNPWDTAAGALLVREAGGVVTDFAGHDYRLGDHELVATNKLIHDEVKAVGAEIAAGRSSVPEAALPPLPVR